VGSFVLGGIHQNKLSDLYWLRWSCCSCVVIASSHCSPSCCCGIIVKWSIIVSPLCHHHVMQCGVAIMLPLSYHVVVQRDDIVVCHQVAMSMTWHLFCGQKEDFGDRMCLLTWAGHSAVTIRRSGMSIDMPCHCHHLPST